MAITRGGTQRRGAQQGESPAAAGLLQLLPGRDHGGVGGDKGYRYEGQAFGIGSAFLLAGVQNYVGTFWVVHDEESVGFALAFYQHLATGLTLGGALQQARQAIIKHHDGQGLTWASYLLYGDPTAALLPAHTESCPLAPLPLHLTVESSWESTMLLLRSGLP